MSNPTKASSVSEAIQNQLSQALVGVMLNDELLRTFVTEALNQKVPQSGYSRSDDPPFLKVVIDEAIRNGAKQALHKVVNEQQPQIEAMVREVLQDSIPNIAASLSKSLVDAAERGYISVTLELPRSEENRHY